MWNPLWIMGCSLNIALFSFVICPGGKVDEKISFTSIESISSKVFAAKSFCPEDQSCQLSSLVFAPAAFKINSSDSHRGAFIHVESFPLCSESWGSPLSHGTTMDRIWKCWEIDFLLFEFTWTDLNWFELISTKTSEYCLLFSFQSSSSIWLLAHHSPLQSKSSCLSNGFNWFICQFV